MSTKQILLTQGFARSISNRKFDAEKVKNILNAKNATKFMEAVNAIGDELLVKEAQTIYKEFGFTEYSFFSFKPFERYNEFIMYLKFNI